MPDTARSLPRHPLDAPNPMPVAGARSLSPGLLRLARGGLDLHAAWQAAWPSTRLLPPLSPSKLEGNQQSEWVHRDVKSVWPATDSL